MKVNTDNVATICCIGGYPTADNDAIAVVTYRHGSKASFNTHREAEESVARYNVISKHLGG